MRRVLHILFPLLLVGFASQMIRWTIHSKPVAPAPPPQITYTEPIRTELEQYFRDNWTDVKIQPAEFADDLQLYRRLSLVLHGTVPSLAEIREFQKDQEPQRVERWTERLLEDPRFADYFAQRFSRFLVGNDDGQFIVFRRDRFEAWLSHEIRKSTPYDQIVRSMMSDSGLWTGEPQTNFVTAAVANSNLDVTQLTGRSVRAFLGQRIDCAQCHDHPFDHWKQKDFEGLAGYFGQVRQTVAGIEDKPQQEYYVEDRKSLQQKLISPEVPHHPEWSPSIGTRREKLAVWMTHPENRAFERAIVNRVWGLMFGRPWIEPVDGMPDPPVQADLLDLLGKDFRSHQCDLKRLIRVIAASPPFRRASAVSPGNKVDAIELSRHWALFPLSRLRPEQVIGAMLQGASVRTIDQNSHLLVRTVRFFREKDFVRDYGTIEGEELEERPGTIPQALLRMNGRLTRELGESNPLTSVGRISALSPSDIEAVNALFLACLTRFPNEDERNHFVEQLEGLKQKQRDQVLEDLYWSLVNSPEFSWNH